MASKSRRAEQASCQHEIQRGETLSGIAAASNQGMNELYERNRSEIGSNPDHIEAGSWLDTCGGASSSPSDAWMDEHSTTVNDGKTMLLRATGDSDRRRAQYNSIQRSGQTGSILLRSI
ncbi:MAG: LysM peptidoglycan-binding domain-containing protein [Myxococcales bacterium]|nr:LysM peptidoglycan-binding domain-containing protein [Myxococcales bacterium]MCB9693471.1 LysM peptidoglycan-binding domain-containing protein [Alphaproteobacteria bacterium]